MTQAQVQWNWLGDLMKLACARMTMGSVTQATTQIAGMKQLKNGKNSSQMQNIVNYNWTPFPTK